MENVKHKLKEVNQKKHLYRQKSEKIVIQNIPNTSPLKSAYQWMISNVNSRSQKIAICSNFAMLKWYSATSSYLTKLCSK
jgi:hypothetical protein